MEKDGTTLGDPCPACGEYSYQGGYCLNPKCGKFRPSKHNKHNDNMDTAQFMEANFGRQIDIFLTEGTPQARDDEDEDIWSPKEGE